MKKYLITWRLVNALWLDDNKWQDFLSLIQKEPALFDRIAFFVIDDTCPSLPPPEDKQKQIDVLQRRFADLNALGIESGINVWPSLNLYEAERNYYSHFRRMVSDKGRTFDELACPTGESFLEYTKEKLRIFAKSGAKFIWVDDDCRFTHHNFSFPEYHCFCDDCVRNFMNGKFGSRKELIRALNEKDNRDLRIHWSSYGADRLAAFCKVVRETVDEIDPAIDTPFMTVGATHTTFSGDYIQKCMTALRSKQGRPGHGVYSEREIFSMQRKMLDVGRQTEAYPDFVTDVLYEEESHPQTYLHKSFKMRRNEATLSIMAGCNGIAYNHLGVNGGVHLSYARELEELAQIRPKLDKILDFSQGLIWTGMWPAASWFFKAKQNPEDDWFRSFEHDQNKIKIPEPIGPCGVALTSDTRGASVVLLAGNNAEIFTDDELKEILAHQVVMDATALEVLEKRGLGHLTGVRLGNDVRGCCYLSDHSFTRNVEGFRTLDQLTTKELLSLDDRVEFLGYISESDERTHVYRCISKFENELGGKIIVDTSDPWRLSDDVGRVKLLSSVSKWMGCPYIEWENDLTPSRIQPFVKTDGKKALIMLLNPSTDSSNPFFITLRGKMKDAALIRNDGTEISLEAEALDGALRISVPSVEAWDIATLFAR